MGVNSGIAKKLGIVKQVDAVKIAIDNKKKQNYLNQRTKYFCVGSNKTGTTSLARAFKNEGFIVGNQREAELLTEDYFKGDFKKILKYCKTAEAFQDVPFSWPDTYKKLDKNFSNAKFILTVRDSSDQWYNSVVNFHAKIFGKGKIPNWELLKNTEYVYRGWAHEIIQKLYNLTLNDDPYDKEVLIDHYEKHNNDVLNYFKDRSEDLLVINLSEKDAYQRFCNFIGVKSDKTEFPWENKT